MAMRHHRQTTTNLLNQMTCFIAWAAALLLLPVIFLLWLTESPQQRAKRWRKAGQSYKTIASRLSISPTTARRWCLS